MRFKTKLMYAVTGIIPAPLLRPIFSYRSNRAFKSHLSDSAEKAFTTISEQNAWAGSESVSGSGSDMSSTGQVRESLPKLMNEMGLRSLLDAPCGDFLWMQRVSLEGIQYVGADIVTKLIENNQKQFGNESRRFIHADLTKSDLPTCDLILCRDCFIHLSFRDIGAALANFKRSGAKYLLTTHYPHMRLNWDIHTGAFRPVNLSLWPFNISPPQSMLPEDPPTPELAGNPNFDRVLGLWDMQKINLSPALG